MEAPLQEIKINEIFSDEEFNSRGHITPASVLDLSKDIERDSLIQPIAVQPYDKAPYKWRIVAGHRRHLACKLWMDRGGPDVVKCCTMPSMPEHKALILNIKENLSRENLGMLQEARAIEKFLKWGWTAKQVAAELGIYKKWVEIRFALLTMDEHIQKRVEAKFLTQHQIEDLMRMSSNEERHEYVKKCVNHKLGMDAIVRRKPNNAKKRSAVAGGEVRTQNELFEEQERIQDCFDDLAHPAAVALGWAAGAISTEAFYKHCETWAKAENLMFKRPIQVA